MKTFAVYFGIPALIVALLLLALAIVAEPGGPPASIAHGLG